MTSRRRIAEFNKANPDLTVKLVEFPEDAQQQHDQFVQRQKAKSGDCDGFESDVVWTAEFASQKWLMDMTDYINGRKDKFIPSTLETATYDGKIFGAPRASDAGPHVLPHRPGEGLPGDLAGPLQAGRRRQRLRLPGRRPTRA